MPIAGADAMGMGMALLLLCLTILMSSSAAASYTSQDDLVRTSCVHASYPDLCIRTLSSYGGPPAKTPRDLAQAAVKISLSRAGTVSEYLRSRRSSSNSREDGAVNDCLEQISESMDDLSKTLEELKHLRHGTFRWQMSNAETWVSAALTNENTCLDGFNEINGDKVKVRSADVKRKITDVARITSNALYLITRLDPARRNPSFGSRF